MFPMAEDKDSNTIRWMSPQRRGIMPLNRFRISRSLRRTLTKHNYGIKIDYDFAGTIAGCADRDTTWINDDIRKAYLQLHKEGYAHSLEVWNNSQLVGGVYGVTLGAAFFGESMFSRQRDSSKVALAFLISQLRQTGFVLFDVQYLTSHLASLGAIEINQEEYKTLLKNAIRKRVNFLSAPIAQPHEVIQRSTQTSNRG